MKKQLIIIGCLLIATGLLFFMKRPEESQELPLASFEEVSEEIEPTPPILEPLVYVVDLKGEVKIPGIYEVESTSRVHDVIELAGGFLETANVNAVNLAEKVRDEMVIYIPHIDEPLPQAERVNETEGEKKVSLNQATLEEFQTLPGIGPAKAMAIINYREEFGMFNSVDELTNVSGIGEKTLEKLRDHLEL